MVQLYGVITIDRFTTLKEELLGRSARFVLSTAKFRTLKMSRNHANVMPNRGTIKKTYCPWLMRVTVGEKRVKNKAIQMSCPFICMAKGGRFSTGVPSRWLRRTHFTACPTKGVGVGCGYGRALQLVNGVINNKIYQ
jgi:hypothetical protein